MSLKHEVARLADGTRTVKEIADAIGNGVSLVSVYRVIREHDLREMVASAYGSRGIMAKCRQQRKALKAIIALDPNSAQGKLAAMGLEDAK